MGVSGGHWASTGTATGSGGVSGAIKWVSRAQRGQEVGQQVSVGPLIGSSGLESGCNFHHYCAIIA